MREIFYEESAEIQNKKSASTKYNIFKVLSIVSYVLFVLWCVIVLTIYPLSGNVLVDIIGIILPMLAFLPSGIILGRIKNKFYVEYDYTFVSGSIRFSKIIKNTKRKLIIKFDVSSIEKLGKYGSQTFNKYEAMPGINKLILTSNYEATSGKDFYYLVINYAGAKKLLILECTEIFMVNILKFASKNIIEEDFK